ncbi:hypothetical protein AABB24_024939, partial [Solanum stoloniferum]
NFSTLFPLLSLILRHRFSLLSLLLQPAKQHKQQLRRELQQLLRPAGSTGENDELQAALPLAFSGKDERAAVPAAATTSSHRETHASHRQATSAGIAAATGSPGAVLSSPLVLSLLSSLDPAKNRQLRQQ